ncbi:SDR family NAD(P)-dependent oxidoreductase [Schlesneria sp. DSM 10557]|uniref:SDR family NAD(P)-dependent oxidoreductase n=1 Tax=Schlesneria sp. DSM 10557 TaxID=3044399 RepID=UPI0035A14D6A
MNLPTKCLVGAATAMGGYLLGKELIRRTRRFPFREKVAVIMGGSRGLGLEIARLLVQQGCRVAICARTEADLETARKELSSAARFVITCVCDVRSTPDVERAIAEVAGAWNRIDLLFNVAGLMQVGPLESMTSDDFQEAMNINLWGPYRSISAALPHMRKQKFGRIVNIASIGGIQAIPHMAPYSTSKHALVGLSHALRTELAQEGILVTTACPTIMRTGSPRNATFKGRHRDEYTWFDIGASIPWLSLESRSAARQIVRACWNGDGEVDICNFLNPATLAVRWAPRLTAEAMSVANRLLPPMGGIQTQSAYGYESESPVAPSWLTRNGDLAAERNNQMRPRPEPA